MQLYALYATVCIICTARRITEELAREGITVTVSRVGNVVVVRISGGGGDEADSPSQNRGEGSGSGTGGGGGVSPAFAAAAVAVATVGVAGLCAVLGAIRRRGRRGGLKPHPGRERGLELSLATIINMVKNKVRVCPCVRVCVRARVRACVCVLVLVY